MSTSLDTLLQRLRPQLTDRRLHDPRYSRPTRPGEITVPAVVLRAVVDELQALRSFVDGNLTGFHPDQLTDRREDTDLAIRETAP